jgi:protein-arginine kinase activator protein McsA
MSKWLFYLTDKDGNIIKLPPPLNARTFMMSREETEKHLQNLVDQENYEEAAIVRDELRLAANKIPTNP